MKRPPIVLLVLDGWGRRTQTESNAIAEGAPYFHDLLGKHPNTLLTACGKEVGLPAGVMGNSEVGHTNLGAGRVVYQDVTRIDKSIQDGEFVQIPALLDAMAHVRKGGGKLHFVGLVSDGMVHASNAHLARLLELSAAEGLGHDNVCVHAITDGRDTPPQSGVKFLQAVERDCERAGAGRIVSVIGRYFAMDRDKRWERVKKGYDLFVHGVGNVAPSATAALEASYAGETTDEFCEPTVIAGGEDARIAKGDAVFFFNYRADRMRQIVDVFTQPKFDGFDRGTGAPLDLHIASMTQYRDDFSFPVAYPSVDLTGIFPEIISAAGLRQERIAETEKYAHVTYFFSGGNEAEYPGETRTLIQSQRVATYDLAPAMSAEGITEAILKSLDRGETDVYIVNFANADMVGHTGKYSAALAAVKTVDACLARIVPAIQAKGGTVAITADHGNSEQLWDEKNQQPHTAHTLNPVPFVLIGEGLAGVKMRERGVLADVAPTMLEIIGMEKHSSMDGVSLISR